MNGTGTVQGGVVAPVQGRMRDARVKDNGAGEASEDFDEVLSQGTEAAEQPEAEPATEEVAPSDSRQGVAVSGIASLGFIFAAPGEEAAEAAPDAPADPMAALKAALASVGQQGDAAEMPDDTAQDPVLKSDAGSAAEALALLGASSETDAPVKPSEPKRDTEATTVTIAGTKQETHFAPVAAHHSAAAAGPSRPVADSSIRQDAVADRGETALDAPRGPAVGAQQGGSEANGKSDGEPSRDGSAGDRRTAQASGVTGAEFVAAAAGTTEVSDAASPAQQIARRVAGELGAGGNLAAARVETAPGGPGGMMKVLHIQLSPANLGTVTVHVSLKDNVLNLHVETARHETALAIEKDRELLSTALKQSGYMVDGITTQASDLSRASASVQAAGGADAQSSFSSSTQSQSGQSHSGSQSDSGNTRPDGMGEDRSSQRRMEPAAGVNDRARGTARGASGEVYV